MSWPLRTACSYYFFLLLGGLQRNFKAELFTRSLNKHSAIFRWIFYFKDNIVIWIVKTYLRKYSIVSSANKDCCLCGFTFVKWVRLGSLVFGTVFMVEMSIFVLSSVLFVFVHYFCI